MVTWSCQRALGALLCATIVVVSGCGNGSDTGGDGFSLGSDEAKPGGQVVVAYEEDFNGPGFFYLLESEGGEWVATYELHTGNDDVNPTAVPIENPGEIFTPGAGLIPPDDPRLLVLPSSAIGDVKICPYPENKGCADLTIG